jgi:hypothetical protein
MPFLADGPARERGLSAAELPVKKLPKSDNSLLLRTDFSDDSAWGGSGAR